MATYIYSKWHNSPPNYPIEFFSELDSFRNETRKIEVFKGGRLGYSSISKSTSGTKLGTIPVPSLAEIQMQHDFETKEIRKEEFERKWIEAIEQKQR